MQHIMKKNLLPLKDFKTLKNKSYNYMISISKNVYIDKLDDKVNKCSNTYHSTIKMMLVNVECGTYVVFNKENDKEDPKFKVGDHVRILKYKKIFAKHYVSNC